IRVPGLGSGSGVTVTDVSAGVGLSYARTDQGTVLAWGANDSGQLGNGHFDGRKTPAQVLGLPWIQWISAQGAASQSFARGANDTVWAWGLNSSGELGIADGDTTNRPTPVSVSSLAPMQQIVAARSFSLGLTADGSVWA